MSIALHQILDLVGKLDDSPGDNTPRERFRRFLTENVVEIGQIRDYIEECLRTAGSQYSRALQDVVNHVGRFLGFAVTFGRYQGTQGQIGFDGHWISPTGFHIAVEVKTTEVYAIKTASLVGYVDRLISAQSIPSWEDALGLYVVGRPDPEIKQLENAIVAEKRTNQLRIVSVDSLLSLAELMSQYDIHHDDMLEVLRPSAPTIDSVVHLMERLVSGTETDEVKVPESKVSEPSVIQPIAEGAVAYWLTPVKSYKEESAEDCIKHLVGQAQVYAFGENTPGRKRVKPGDWICFYATGTGVIAHARIVSLPEKNPHPAVRQKERFPWVFKLDDAKLYLGNPVVIDATLRSTLDAFEGRDLQKSWAWFVQATKSISEHDFHVLTRT